MARKQLVLALVDIVQGQPLVNMASGHSQDGNNNAYCQDSEISYLSMNRLLGSAPRTLHDGYRKCGFRSAA